MFTASVVLVVIALIALVISFFVKSSDNAHARDVALTQQVRKWTRVGSVVVTGLAAVCFVFSMMITVPPGHVGVGTLFGKVYAEHRDEGLNFVNPLSEWRYFDCRQKAYDTTAQVPSMDQLQTKFDATVKFRINKEMAAEIFKETGNVDVAIKTHLVPKFRSLLREQGKSVAIAEDFYKEEVQVRLQNNLRDALATNLAPKGIEIEEILIRDIDLPEEIDQGVKNKKIRDQEAEKQKSELRRFETEQQQKVKQAEAERQAAEEEAKMIKLLADARAYEIERKGKAIAKYPVIIKLEALKSLQAISKDPNAKIYFLNGDSPQPLPLMHLGDK